MQLKPAHRLRQDTAVASDAVPGRLDGGMQRLKLPYLTYRRWRRLLPASAAWSAAVVSFACSSSGKLLLQSAVLQQWCILAA